MDSDYIVFQDSLRGLVMKPTLGAKTLEEIIKNIEKSANQCYMYFIYKEHEANIPLYGTRFDTYKYVKAVAGSKVGLTTSNKEGLRYAITHNSSMAFFFTDDIFGDLYTGL